MGIESAFLNEILQKEVYMDQTHKYEIKNQEHKVYKLKKALYCLKQTLRAWYGRIIHICLGMDFE